MGFSKAQLITGGLGLVGGLASKFLDAVGLGNLGAQGVSHIWKFVDYTSKHFPGPNTSDRKYGFGAAPDIASVGNQGAALGNSQEQTIDHIDVVNDFQWTQSPKSSRSDVPVLFLREKKIQTNPQLNQIANNLFTLSQKAARGAGEENVEELKSMINASKAAIIKGGEATTGLLSTSPDLSGSISGINKNVAKAATNTSEFLNKSIDKLTVSDQPGVLAPYEQLYYTKDTGFVYSLPYLEPQYKQVQNQFGNDGGANSAILGTAANMSKTAANIATGLNIMDPGTYIEQPQLYNFGGRNKTYTIKFPLINTNSWNDVVRNWQLIWMLIYQNTPNRLTRDLIDPPCIYEASLDGTWYSKYAYISQLSVDFVGATRKMTIPVRNDSMPDGGGSPLAGMLSVDTIIPDAYEVTLSVVDIFGETRNMLYHSVNQTNSKITVQSGPQSMVDTAIGTVENKVRGALGGLGNLF